jgi:predicted Zn-dependent protease
MLGSCATLQKGVGGGGDKGSSSSSLDNDDGDTRKSQSGNDDLYVSSNYQTLTYSLSNNSLTSKTINVSRAKDLAGDLEGKLSSPSVKDRKDLIALMAAKRLAGEGVGPVFQVAKKLMVVEMKEDIRHEMPEVAQLELALASIHSRQFPMAEHWINKLMSSRNEKTKAAALTARGMIAMIDGRLPEAVAFWNDAIGLRKDYEPARLNIGFTALRYGDYKTAKAMLSGLPNDFFVTTGMIQIERLADNPKDAAQLCAAVLKDKRNYKPALFSCALNEYQGLGNLAKARNELEEIAKTDGGPSTIDERAYVVIGKLEKEIREQQAKERAAAAARQQQAQPAGGQPAQQGAPAAPPKP